MSFPPTSPASQQPHGAAQKAEQGPSFPRAGGFGAGAASGLCPCEPIVRLGEAMPVPSWGCLVPGVTAGTASTAHGSEGMDGPARLPQPCSLREEPALCGNSGSA